MNVQKNKWKHAKTRRTADTLSINGFQVMQRWEEPCMMEMARNVAQSGGDVLEVGFGMGISAFFINKHSPRSHTIIEANHEVAEQAREFARQNPNVKVIEGFWQDVIEQIANESYDGVLFDTYPIDGVHEDEDAFYAHAKRILRPQGVLTFYVSCESEVHEDDEYLSSLGFKTATCKVAVTPPGKSCEYWDKSKHMLVPRCQKSIDVF
jgi:guanidinoacetate N-methyltransferase